MTWYDASRCWNLRSGRSGRTNICVASQNRRVLLVLLYFFCCLRSICANLYCSRNSRFQRSKACRFSRYRLSVISLLWMDLCHRAASASLVWGLEGLGFSISGLHEISDLREGIFLAIRGRKSVVYLLHGTRCHEKSFSLCQSRIDLHKFHAAADIPSPAWCVICRWREAIRQGSKSWNQ